MSVVCRIENVDLGAISLLQQNREYPYRLVRFCGDAQQFACKPPPEDPRANRAKYLVAPMVLLPAFLQDSCEFPSTRSERVQQLLASLALNLHVVQSFKPLPRQEAPRAQQRDVMLRGRFSAAPKGGSVPTGGHEKLISSSVTR